MSRKRGGEGDSGAKKRAPAPSPDTVGGNNVRNITITFERIGLCPCPTWNDEELNGFIDEVTDW
jgi:hypothetical protein